MNIKFAIETNQLEKLFRKFSAHWQNTRYSGALMKIYKEINIVSIFMPMGDSFLLFLRNVFWEAKLISLMDLDKLNCKHSGKN